MQAQTLTPFQFNSQPVRVVTDDAGEPWFVAKDVCAILDMDVTQVRRLDDDEKGLRKIQTHGGTQEMQTVNESGLYTLVIRSNKPQAKPFRKWVTAEVLPSIRKTGQYTAEPVSINVRDPQQLAVIATQLAQLTQELQADLGKAQHQIEQDRPKVRLAEQFCSTDNTHSLIAAAAHFGGKPGQPGTVKALKNFLRTQGLWKSRLFGMANDEPTAKAIDRGFFICREIEIVANGIPRMIPDWRFTQRGMLAIERLIHAPLESIADQAGLF